MRTQDYVLVFLQHHDACVFPPLPEDNTICYCTQAAALVPTEEEALLATLRRWDECPPCDSSADFADTIKQLLPFRLPHPRTSAGYVLPHAASRFMHIDLMS